MIEKLTLAWLMHIELVSLSKYSSPLKTHKMFGIRLIQLEQIDKPAGGSTVCDGPAVSAWSTGSAASKPSPQTPAP